MSTTVFNGKKVNFSKLQAFGFGEENGIYKYQKQLPNAPLLLNVVVDSKGEVEASIIDPNFEEPYTLHLVKGAMGNFVAEVREVYEESLQEIAAKCFDGTSTSLVSDVVAYVKDTYGDELEYLWENSQSGIWRRMDNRKWYGALLQVSARKLGIPSDEIWEIIDLRIKKGEVEALIDNEYYFPGYHMNKKSWYTMVLDGRVSLEEVCRRIDESYVLALKK